jgi:hypothetical protein
MLRPGCLSPGSNPVPVQEAEWVLQLTGQVQKILPQPGFDPWTVQPRASRYTDYTIPAHLPYLYSEMLLRKFWKFQDNHTS